ncbi:Type IV fimbrial assembly protein PilC [hydrothermal vent metagenome]|uniref:Type IV fimbrial assembly protein PilC n=1 Tax=hydrothermal vent metagenome TaxID=652676 RepID=A0A3B0QKB1_9ZZZZ
MAVYKIKAGTLEGKILYKEIAAESRAEVELTLEKEGLYPIDIRLKGLAKEFLSKPLSFGAPRVKSEELLIFNQGFSTLLRAGLPVVESLETMAQSCDGVALGEALKEVLKRVKEGSSLSLAMGASPAIFSKLYVASIAAGEKTGDLVPSITGHIEYQKRIDTIRKKITSAAIYPAVLALASIGVVIFLISYVVPSFAGLYVDTGAELPMPTRVLIGFSDLLQTYYLLIIAVIVISVLWFKAFARSKRGTFFIDGIKLSMPYLGAILSGYAMAKFTRTLGMVLSSGVPLLEGLRMSKGVLANMVLEEKLERIIVKTEQGGVVSDSMEREHFMPLLTMRMFAVGERSASLNMILYEIADYHDQEVNHKVGILTSFIEPALMLIMGTIVAVIVVLMYLPIFQMGANI